MVFLAVAGLVSWAVCNARVWHGTEALYPLLTWIKRYLVEVYVCLCMLSAVAFGYYFLTKPYRYLEALVQAAERLAKVSEEPIRLPQALQHMEDELNLAREQALRSAMLAKEAEQRKNDLIVYLAHDLKTPLTSVIGYLTLLKDEPHISGEIRARYTGIALDKAQRLEDLINEFFDITRFNLTALTLEPESLNLSRMLEQIVSEFEPVLAEKGLVWKTEILPNVSISCDVDKIQRVFDNLIRNAVNYSYEETEITLTMELLEQAVQICVQNHGRTIPPEKLSHIFEQFFRVDASRASATGGAGLGLAIANEIVKLHGGTIRAESAHESIAFTVELPR
ncbi:MAG: HAMP domain-containing histidine kinase [Eubacterium sp.]|nr:HAMP domain-containing histidine kinase [Eubacterium sp.]